LYNNLFIFFFSLFLKKEKQNTPFSIILNAAARGYEGRKEYDKLKQLVGKK